MNFHSIQEIKQDHWAKTSIYFIYMYADELYVHLKKKFRLPGERIKLEHIKRSFSMGQSEIDEAKTAALGPRVGVLILGEDLVASLDAPEAAIVELCEGRFPQKVSPFHLRRRPLLASTRRHW